jgi:dethiobiotin synthetase
VSVYFITGINTDVGKTYAAGLAARFLRRRGTNVMTQKMVQTGATKTIADDILLHRRLMDIDILPEDRDGTTCPYLFRFPASPHLSATQEGTHIDPRAITRTTARLLETFDTVLLEGAGGLCVPLRRNYLTADYVQECQYPIIVVTSGRLGSINHTLLTLESAANRNIPLAGIVFNHFPPSNVTIRNETLHLFRHQLVQYGRPNALVEMPEIDFDDVSAVDFSPIFG